MDLLLTLPLLAYSTYDIFARHANLVEFLLPALLVLIMFPSIAYIFRWSLPQVLALVCLLAYAGFALILVFRTVADRHDAYPSIFLRVGIILLIAKSVYGVVCVTKPANP
ncbi:MAG: hypothetical protein IT579_04650 [Verrucomicrobia subdivision 3 bacterium]|nr:hypothetical protein [Limisphaerales bacterium]